MTTGVFSWETVLNLLGICSVLGVAWLCSYRRRAIDYTLVAKGLALHVGIAIVMLKTYTGGAIMQRVADGIASLYAAADKGIEFMFGPLSKAQDPWGFIFAFQVLPIIIFFGAFMNILYYYGIIQRAMWFLYRMLRPLLGTSGAETLCAVSNSVLGQTEAPLLIKNYLRGMTRSEVMLVMVSGMGTISAALVAVYASLGVPTIHLLTASLLGVPSTIIMAKILYPETEAPNTVEDVAISYEGSSSNVLDAIAQGSLDGLQLVLNVGAILIAFIALINALNGIIAGAIYLGNYVLPSLGIEQLSVFTLQDMFGLLLAPVGWLLGVSTQEAYLIGQLIGTKLTINEMIAFSRLVDLHLSERATILATYALCGFANFSCIGIQIGGIGALEPQKRSMLSELGLTAVVGGTLANFLSAFVAGLLI